MTVNAQLAAARTRVRIGHATKDDHEFIARETARRAEVAGDRRIADCCCRAIQFLATKGITTKVMCQDNYLVRGESLKKFTHLYQLITIAERMGFKTNLNQAQRTKVAEIVRYWSVPK
jgi:hypothetical protein